MGKILKIFFPKTIGPEKFRSVWKLSDIVQRQICQNLGPKGWGRVTIGGNHIYICVYLGGKNL
jgi:hypothetical protein